jgi:hypothetical protein
MVEQPLKAKDCERWIRREQRLELLGLATIPRSRCVLGVMLLPVGVNELTTLDVAAIRLRRCFCAGRLFRLWFWFRYRYRYRNRFWYRIR